MTDRRTDRQNYDSQDRASIAASRGNNYRKPFNGDRNVLKTKVLITIITVDMVRALYGTHAPIYTNARLY